jgi:organic hydroperoxide reductase OsmC/OhrA
MSEHRASVDWKLETPGFGYKEYNRDHLWRFEGGAEVEASAAPAYLGNPERVDPEKALVAALSSCHMLTFLAIASRKGYVVESYRDDAVGHMTKDARGRLAITRVELSPRIEFRGKPPADEELASIHDEAHHHCFIANSVLTEVTVVGLRTSSSS